MASALPGTVISKVNGSLTLVPAGTPLPMVIGPCSNSGSLVNTQQVFSQVAAINSALGYGPAVTAAQIILRQAGGEVIVIPSNASTAGSVSAVTSGSAGPAFTVSGLPYESYQATVQVTTAGSVSSSYFAYSLDGGSTFSNVLPMTGTFPVPNTGLVFNFPVGQYGANLTYGFTTQEPTMNATDLGNAFQAVSGSNVSPEFMLLAGCSRTSATTQATLFNSLDAELTTLDNINLFPGAIIPTGGVPGSTAATISAFAPVASADGNVCMAVAEYADCILPAPFQGYGNPLLPYAYAAAAHAASTLTVAVNPAEKELQGIPGWSNPSYDELVNGAVYITNKIVAPRTFKASGGVFLNQANLKVNPGSNYVLWPWGQVINLIAETVQPALENYVNKSQQVLTDGTGRLTQQAANGIDSTINSLLRTVIMQPQNGDGFTGLASGVQFLVDRAKNVLASSTVSGVVNYTPNANVAKVTIQIGFAAALP